MIYSALTRLAEPLLRLQSTLGGQDALRERLVMDARPVAADIWIHGASVGELTSARTIIEDLARDFSVLVTTNTETARQMVTGWGLAARLAPMDLPGTMQRFLNAVHPRLQVTIEGEFWPLRSRELARRGIPQTMIGARMSAKSAGNWGRFPRLIRPILERVEALSAQDALSEERLLRLGARPAAILPKLDLKLLGPAQISPPVDSAARDMTFLAASTHEGEEQVFLDAFVEARKQHSDLRLILAIRHPKRGDEVANLIEQRGLPVIRRSQGAEDGPVLLVDTLGEMARWYAAAGLCFVGGSLNDRGGHTPWEPAAYQCAILYGPHVSNFPDAYAALTAADAARQVTVDSLQTSLAEILAQPARIRAMGHAGRNVLDQRVGAPDGLVTALRDLAKRAV
ncbi:3-deoxy-D-manno-octulosonic acid transferase [Paracoccus sp. 11-3]|uniref:3-deoxy-D-manno-octulosonic acid transferase n=2 Tax=Paracoccus amoyensis TaxID=2760093 RepID=A0A926GEX1_9RHOB|nr:3-deoxy-D-manno-octulosonic acid transferase [Paracoccus amoyensis]